MAKRSNPFTEDFVPQSKVHVGMKQYNNNEDRLKKVYEKTLELLFRGANKPVKRIGTEPEDISTSKKDGYKQLFIGKDGHLLQSGVMVSSGRSGRSECSGRCACGAVSSCAYCEARVCECERAGGERRCARCARPHCYRCSLTRSEGVEICMSCYC